MNNYLDKKQIAEKLSITPKGVTKLMKKWQVPTYYLGPGRGLGYRWLEDDVEAILNSRQVNTQPRKKRKKKPSIFDMSAKEAMKLKN